MPNHTLEPIGENRTKKSHLEQIYGISCEGPVFMERVLENADISILNNFFFFFSISRNFAKFYLFAKFQINWTIQIEIIVGGGGEQNLQKARPV